MTTVVLTIQSSDIPVSAATVTLVSSTMAITDSAGVAQTFACVAGDNPVPGGMALGSASGTITNNLSDGTTNVQTFTVDIQLTSTATASPPPAPTLSVPSAPVTVKSAV